MNTQIQPAPADSAYGPQGHGYKFGGKLEGEGDFGNGTCREYLPLPDGMPKA